MIRRIKGEIVATDITSVVVDVGGVGYLIHTSVAGTYFEIGTEAVFHTYQAVRETALDLYGFQNPKELAMFELLITLPKVGPKSALQIMSQADLDTLQKAITTEDATYLSKMSGIGKKTAEKIVLELKDKIDDFTDASNASNQSEPSDMQHMSDIIDVLITLGYPQKDARDAVQAIAKDTPEVLTDTNATIKAALQKLGG